MKRNSAPALQWAVIDGTLQHISQFAHLPPGERPDAICPVCGRKTIMRLGPIRAHHLAHEPGVVCPATQPETAVYMNARFYLWHVLSQSRTFRIRQPCIGWQTETEQYSCKNNSAIETIFAAGWNRVEIEYPLSSYNLDIALLEGDKVICAIEIVVGRISKERKYLALTEQGIPWLEIVAAPDLYTPPTAWMGKTPLVPSQYNHPQLPDWQCSECEKAARQWESDTSQTWRKAISVDHHDWRYETHCLRIVDYFYPSGKHFRCFFTIETKYQRGQPTTMLLQRLDRQRKRIVVLHQPFPKNALERLQRMFALVIKGEQGAHPDWIIDTTRGWMKPYPGFHPRRWMLWKYPLMYRWNPEKRIWEPKSADPAQKAPVQLQQTSSQAFSGQPFAGEYRCRRCGRVTADWVVRYNSRECLCRQCAYSNDL